MCFGVPKGLAGGVLAAVAICAACIGRAGAAETFHVAKAYDGKPFDYAIRLLAERDTYRVYGLTYPSPVVTPVAANNTIPAEYYVPKDVGPGHPKRPAVVCLHILDGNFELVRMVGASLASRGVAAILFKLPYYGERALPGGHEALLGDPKRFVGAMQQAVEDVRRTVDLLASREEVDPRHIGVVGISLGGLLGATAAAEEPRLSRAALILAGGDLAKIIDTADEARAIRQFLARLDPAQQQELRRAIAAVDPLNHAAALGERAEQGRVLMFNGTEDRVIPKECAQRLATALGMGDRVQWLDGLGHYTAMAAMPEILSGTVDFFAQDLPDEAKPTSSPATLTPTLMVGRLLGDVGALMAVEPEAGRCHLVDLSVEATLKDGKPIEASLELVRGHGDRFRVAIDLKRPYAIAAALGNDGTPWMSSSGKAVFRGTLGPAAEPTPAVDPEHLLKLRVAAGAVTTAGMMPNLLDGLVTVEEETPVGGARAVRIVSRRKAADGARLVLTPSGRSPDRLELRAGGVRGTVKFRVWQINTIAQDPLFAPRGDLPVTEVRREDVERMFVALFNFAMEKVE